MKYHFDERELIQKFALANLQVPELDFIRKDKDNVEIDDISGGGMVNYVFRVRSADHKTSIVIKYGEEYCRLDKTTKTSLGRQQLEYDSLCLMNSIYPGSAPEAYCLDNNFHILVLEDLTHMELQADVLKRGEINLDAPKNVGKIIGTIHRETCQARCTKKKWEELQAKFRNIEHLNFYCEWTIHNIFLEDSISVKIGDGIRSTYRIGTKAVGEKGLIQKLQDVFVQPVCFVHADCHFEAIFVKGADIKIFDFEFAYLSYPAMQPSWQLAAYVVMVLEFYNVFPNLDRKQTIAKAKQAHHNLLGAYFDEFNPADIGKRKEDFMTDVALFTGHALLVFSTWVTIDSLIQHTDVQKCWAIERACKIMLEHEKFTTVDGLIEALFQDIENVGA